MSFNEIYATSTVPSNKPEENSVIALSQLLGRLEKLISHTKSKLIVYKQGNDSHLYTEYNLWSIKQKNLVLFIY